jgi:hypothetical protein
MEDNQPSEGLQFFESASDLEQSLSQETQAEAPAPVQEEVVETAPETVQEEQPAQEEFQESQYVDPEAEPMDAAQANDDSENYSDEEIEAAVYTYLSERLGRDINSLDDFQPQQASQADERLQVIAKFVEDTGRSPQDWFAYQSLNPSEMDDVTAVRVQMASEYPNLAPEELNMLIESKYKLDPDLHSEDEIRLSQLQMKIDGEKARRSIDDIRSQYLEPELAESEEAPMFDDQWRNNLNMEVEALTGLEFDLGNGNSFTYGLNEQYKSRLRDVNSRPENYLDPYIREDGSWDYDTFNSHRAVIDNIDAIVSSAYKQGQSDGQRGLVEKAANVSSPTPTQNTGQPREASIPDQLQQLISGGGAMTFKI